MFFDITNRTKDYLTKTKTILGFSQIYGKKMSIELSTDIVDDLSADPFEALLSQKDDISPKTNHLHIKQPFAINHRQLSAMMKETKYQVFILFYLSITLMWIIATTICLVHSITRILGYYMLIILIFIITSPCITYLCILILYMYIIDVPAVQLCR